VSKSIVKEGDNYRVELDGDIAHCTVWSRPDLTSETGAQLAAEKVAICSALTSTALGLLFDLREAPKVTGPRTQNSLELLIGAWETAARPIAILVGPAPMQRLQLTRLARAAAPRHGEVFVEFALALEWLEQRLPARTAPQVSSLRDGPGKRRS